MFEDQQQDDQPPRRPSALRRAEVATALVAGVVAGGYGVASAQTGETPTTQAPDDGGTAPDDERGCDRDGNGTSDPSAPSPSGSADASL